MTKEFVFEIGQRVFLREVETVGVGRSVCIDVMGVRYDVSYWQNGDRKIATVYEDEVEKTRG